MLGVFAELDPRLNRSVESGGYTKFICVDAGWVRSSPSAQPPSCGFFLSPGLRDSGMTQPAIAEAMGVSLSTVNRAHMAYDGGGIKALTPKPIGGRQRENMTLSGEKALLACFAKAAGAGEMLNVHDLKAAYEQAIGHPTSNSTIYNLLNRHGWRKLMPRPFWWSGPSCWLSRATAQLRVPIMHPIHPWRGPRFA
jgi:transposase